MSRHGRSNDPNMHPCRGCARALYGREGHYCVYCRVLPERVCLDGHVSRMAGRKQCHHPGCKRRLGRLKFGLDRLDEAERTSGWSASEPLVAGFEQTIAEWSAIPPVEGYYSPSYTGAINVRIKAPGRAWTGDVNPFRSASERSGLRAERAAIGEVSWKSCFACGQTFKPGDAEPASYGGQAYGLRQRIVPAESGRKYSYDSSQPAHKDCPLTPEEDALVRAAHQAVRDAA